MKNSSSSNPKVPGVIRRCGVDDAAMLHRLSVETYVDTFDGTSSDEDMRKYLAETYAEPVLRQELANPDSLFFVISMPSGAQTVQTSRTQGGQNTDNSADFSDAVRAGKPESPVTGSADPARNGKRENVVMGSSDSAGIGRPENRVSELTRSVASLDSGRLADPAACNVILSGYMKLNFGEAQIEDMGPDTMEVQRLYIQKAFKGCGLGTQLMNKALGMARERGLKKVWLGVWEHNEPAKRFYAGKGFVRVGQHDFWQGDDKQTDYLMAREV